MSLIGTVLLRCSRKMAVGFQEENVPTRKQQSQHERASLRPGIKAPFGAEGHLAVWLLDAAAAGSCH